MRERIIPRRRALNGLACSALAGLLAIAYALEYLGGMEPCPLCMFQRVVVLALALVFLVAALQGPRGWGVRVYAVVGGLIAITGIAIALRHLWLQMRPGEAASSCGAGFDYMMDTMPLTEAVGAVLGGSGNCSEVEPVLGLPIPAWTLAAFVAALVWSALVNWPLERR